MDLWQCEDDKVVLCQKAILHFRTLLKDVQTLCKRLTSYFRLNKSKRHFRKWKVFFVFNSSLIVTSTCSKLKFHFWTDSNMLFLQVCSKLLTKDISQLIHQPPDVNSTTCLLLIIWLLTFPVISVSLMWSSSTLPQSSDYFELKYFRGLIPPKNLPFL